VASTSRRCESNLLCAEGDTFFPLLGFVLILWPLIVFVAIRLYSDR